MIPPLAPLPPTLVGELRRLIEQARGAAARSLNSELVWLYWQVGHRLRQDILGEARAAYGDQIVAEVAASLSAEYGRGFGKRNLHHMLRFAEVFPEPEIVHALRAQLGWTHLREIIALDDPLARRFYVELCRLEGWSTRALQQKIAGMLFERTAISKRPEAVVHEALTALARRDRSAIQTRPLSGEMSHLRPNDSAEQPRSFPPPARTLAKHARRSYHGSHGARRVRDRSAPSRGGSRPPRSP